MASASGGEGAATGNRLLRPAIGRLPVARRRYTGKVRDILSSITRLDDDSALEVPTVVLVLHPLLHSGAAHLMEVIADAVFHAQDDGWIANHAVKVEFAAAIAGGCQCEVQDDRIAAARKPAAEVPQLIQPVHMAACHA